MKRICWIILIFLLFLTACASSGDEQASVDSQEVNAKETAEEKPEVDKTKSEQLETEDKKENEKEQEQEKVKTVDTSDIPILKDENLGIDPMRIEIPSISVDAHIEKVGRIENGQMGVPENVDNTGWFKPGTKPGDRGSAVIAGHVDDRTGPSVFYELDSLEVGDEVIIKDENDKKITFEVVGMESFQRNDAPVSEIFGYTSRRMLNLITCTGDFDTAAGTHEERLVVYTELVSSE